MRLVGIPVAAFVVVAVPVLVAQQNQEPTPTPAAQQNQPPAPAEAKLTVRLSGDDGGEGHPVHVQVLAAGQAPKEKMTKLVDASGLKTGTVSADATADA